MTSYPNLIPLSRSEVVGIVDAVEPYQFDRIYGGWWGRAVASGGKESVRTSARRYIEHARLGATLTVELPSGEATATVVRKPFIPKSWPGITNRRLGGDP